MLAQGGGANCKFVGDHGRMEITTRILEWVGQVYMAIHGFGVPVPRADPRDLYPRNPFPRFALSILW